MLSSGKYPLRFILPGPNRMTAFQSRSGASHTVVGWSDQPFWVVVENFADLVTVIGAAAAKEMVTDLCDRIDAITGCAIGEVDIRAMAARIAVQRRCGAALGLSYDELLATVGCAPYECASGSIVLALSPQPTSAELQVRPVALQGERAHECWLADMQVAAIVYQAICEKRLHLVYQPIAGIPGSGAVLYSECLSRILERNGDSDFVSPGIFVPALERLGLTRLFDVSVAREAIRLLENDQKACLGCNVSALSAVDDLWWRDIQKKLAADPTVAARFVVEVTETASFSGLDEAKSFIKNMRMLGCMVALDDFGIGNNSLRVATVTKPDIIKIDASLTGPVAELSFGKEFLPSLVRLSSCLARHVVVEGIACAEDFERSIAAGAEWFQGYYIQPPSPLYQFMGPVGLSSHVR